MLIKQAGIGERLYHNSGQHPLLQFMHPYRGWERYARHRKDRWGYTRRMDRTAGQIFERRNGNFASRLASYTAKLEYDGMTLFAIQTGAYSEGDYYWRGATISDYAYTIRTADDYAAAIDWCLPEDDPNMWDLDWCYSVTFVVAPTSVIEVSQP